MLIQFRVENHRSLRDEQVLSLVASNISSDGNCLLRPEALNEALLPAVALYGANASGKTNVLLALSFMRTAVIASHRSWEPETEIPQEPFALSGRKHEPSLYEIDFLVDSVRYRYGFSLDSADIKEEWLYASPNKKRQMWFSREGDKFRFGREFHGENETIRGFTRPNSLFLSAAAQNNHALVLPIFRWFQRLRFDLRRTRPFAGRIASFTSRAIYQIFDDAGTRQPSLFPEDSEAMLSDRQAIINLLRSADTGIVDVRVEREPIEEIGGRPIRRTNLYFQHKADAPEGAWLPIDVESAGTVTLLELAPYLVSCLRTGGILCVDELEASLHPMLAAAILRQFCSQDQNQVGAQLIFTTHDTNLLGDVLGFGALRRDQVWLTEKDNVGATHLYPLTDFHPRKQENLERGYLQGRYGAVPFLGDFLDESGLPG
jgi:AAA15 family ATPase/GTPase